MRPIEEQSDLAMAQEEAATLVTEYLVALSALQQELLKAYKRIIELENLLLKAERGL